MALCETCCGQPVLSDGQRCAQCMAAGAVRELPRGLIAFGWYTGGQSLRPHSTNMGVKMSVAHLAPVGQAAVAASGRARKPYEGLCGARVKARSATVEHPQRVAQEAMAGERKWCERCFVAAALDELHVPTFRTHRTGVGNQYGRGASGSGGRNTHVTCSCGWTNTSNTTRREQDRNFREHVQDAVRYGLFVVEEERYAPRVVSLHGAASAVNAVGTITDETMRMLRTLAFGDEVVGSSRRERMVTVRRRAMPLIPVRSTDPS
jgi:hypothetical protein